MAVSGDLTMSGPVGVGTSFVSPGYPGPPGPVAEDTALGKLRLLMGRRKPNDDVEFADPDITFTSLTGTSTVTNGVNISYWSDPKPKFTVQDAHLAKLSTWNGDPGPAYNSQTGDSPINAFTVETLVSSRGAGNLSVFLFIGSQGGSTQVMVDGKPTTATFVDMPTNLNGVGQMNFAVKANLHGKKLSIRIPSTVGFFGFIHDNNISLTPALHLPVNAALIADSIGQSHAYPIGVDGKAYPSSSGEDLCWHLEQRTGWNWFCMAQGSTGPLTSNPPSNTAISAFNSPHRLNAIEFLNKKSPLSVIDVLGSVNDGGNRFTFPEYKSGLMSYYANLAIAAPGVPLVVIGPESGFSFGYTDIPMLNAATKEACAESPNVACFLDYYGENWFSGTGAVDAWAGDGNFDLFQSTDRVHLNPYGKKALAERIDNGMEMA